MQDGGRFSARSEESGFIVGFRGKPDEHARGVGDHGEGADRFTPQQAEAFHTVSATPSSHS